ncbi:GDP-fucose protein O-fucosyltransferase protein [Actinidia chinensis var. chinensis]|uniref:O-fucosyltransferase family protein n=1 Tax=Actinidia chinensis var. chinensis TaxID=1590841 RepID=A0A2R6QHZ7_ACTCC|nr:GDP-fucose protein O-fucosyltransferase protein [Actinidia chinensis var. chinensis]
MKKKRDRNVLLIALQILYGILSRRSRSRSLHRRLPLLAAGTLLFLFAVLSFLFPPITNSFNNEIDVRSEVDGERAFLVPTSGGSFGRDIWSSTQSKFFHGCSDANDDFLTAEAKTHPNRYLLIATSGGLNQQRTGITDAVVAAYILNATLVVPKLDQKSFWKDTSNFSEIFDVDWFMSYLSKDVKIIKQLPTKGGKAMSPYKMRVPRKCTPKCYENRVLPVLNKKHAVQLGKFDYRLSNRLDTDLQKLRCRVNYHALKFTNTIHDMGQKLVERMRMKSKHFIALHLRFEPDMLAFSGCDYGGGEKERKELGAIRKRWKSLHKMNPDKERRQGRCPLTPEEVGLMLRALGYGKDVHIYVASGEIHGGEETLAPLKALFPNFHSKETIASKEELAPFSSFSSRMAALDFIVCDESDVFVTNNNGNMARILAGRRRYFGHKPTIRPNAKKLYQLFLSRDNMTWDEFASRIQTNQIGFMGDPNEVQLGKGEFHENPLSCICENFDPKARGDSGSHTRATISHEIARENSPKRDAGGATDEQFTEDEQDGYDTDDADNENGLQGKRLPNRTDSEIGVLLKADQPELEEMFSD